MKLYAILSWARLMIEDKELRGDGDMGLSVAEKGDPWKGSLWSPLTPRHFMISKLEATVNLTILEQIMDAI